MGLPIKLADPKTKDYIRKATKALIKTYPLLKVSAYCGGKYDEAIRELIKRNFSMNHMVKELMMHWQKIRSNGFKLIHRAHQADIDMIKKTF
jgi:hypothetical protein